MGRSTVTAPTSRQALCAGLLGVRQPQVAVVLGLELALEFRDIRRFGGPVGVLLGASRVQGRITKTDNTYVRGMTWPGLVCVDSVGGS